MSKSYAKDQPAGYVNHVRNIAIVGAGGQVGTYITKALLQSGKHTITALTRADSTSVLPKGIKVAQVDYDDHTSLVKAMQGQDVLLITMATAAPKDTSSRLVRAAAEAKVPFILPNEWGLDQGNETLSRDVVIGAPIRGIRQEISDLGVSSYIAFVTGFWYEYSLAFGPVTYGFDLINKKVTFFDDGKTKINTSSFPFVGRAAAALLALKILPDDEDDTSATLSQFRNESVFVSSFTLSQEDMLASLLRVTGDKREDWQIDYVPSTERYAGAIDAMKAGDRRAYATAMYTRVFYTDGAGNFGASKGLHNDILGLEEEDPDTYTKVALTREPTVKGTK